MASDGENDWAAGRDDQPEGYWGEWGDLSDMQGLVRRYSAAADDSSRSEEEREAAILLAVAGTSLEAGEDFEETIRTGEHVRKLFQELGDSTGVVDATRLLLRARSLLAESATAGEDRPGVEGGPSALDERWDSALRQADWTVPGAKAPRQEELDEHLPGPGELRDVVDEGRTEADMEASALLATAERSLQEERLGEAECAGSEALALFRRLGHRASAARACRLLVGVRRIQWGLDRAEQLAEEELERAQEIEDLHGEASMLLSLAELRCERGGTRCEQALREGQQALEMLRELGDKNLEAACLLALTGVYSEQLDAKETMQSAMEAAELYRELGDRRGEAKALHGVAMACSMLDRFQDGLRCTQMALVLFRELKLTRLEAAELNLAAQLHRELGDFQSMLQEAQASMRAARTAGSLPEETASLALHVQALTSLGEAASAERVAEEAGARFQEAGYERGQAAAMDLQVQCLVDSQQLGKALDLARQTLALVRRLADKGWEASVLHTISGIELSSKRYKEAGETARDAIALMNELGDKRGEAVVRLNTLVSIHFESEELDEALEALTRALELFQHLGDKRAEASAFFAASNIFRSLDNLEQAETCAQSARQLYDDLGDTEMLVRVLQTLSNFCLWREEHSEAAELGEEALLLYQKEKDRKGEAEMLLHLCCIHQAALMKFGDEGGSKESKTFRDLTGKADRVAAAGARAAEACGDLEIMAVAKFRLSEVKFINGKFQEALKLTNESLKLYREVKSRLGEGNALAMKAQVLQFLNRYEEALDLAQSALSIGRALGDEHLEALAAERVERITSGQFQALRTEAAKRPEAQMRDGNDRGAAVLPSQTGTLDLEPEVVLGTLRGVLHEVMGVQLEQDILFMDAGMGSLQGIEFRNQVSTLFSGLDVASGVIFEHDTLRRLANHIALQQSSRGTNV